MSSRRPPADYRKGSWFAQQGGSGLRFGGLQGTGPAPGGRAPSPAQKAPSRSSTSTAASTPGASSSHSSRSGGVADALDELLSHARVTLKHLDSLRARQHQEQHQPQKQPSHSAKPQPRVAARTSQRSDPRKAPGFWKPSCNANLWGGGGLNDWSGQNGDSDGDDDSLASSTDDESESHWEFLRRHGLDGKRSPAASAPVGRQTPRSRGSSVPPRRPPTPNRSSGGYHESAKNANRNESFSGRSDPEQSGSTRQGYAASGNAGHSRSGSQPTPPGGRAPGPKSDTGKATRNDAAGGFRFGGSSAQKVQAPVKATGPEADVTAALEAAKASGGVDAARQALKKLLLRWHPDKAMQGDSAEAQAAQAESTRVLRFILKERERLEL